MKYCSHCGKEINDMAVVCPGCGCSVSAQPAVLEEDVPSTGWNVLSFFIPLVGLILYIMNHEKTPRKAKAAGKWALISFCISMGLTILLYVLGMVAVLL